jgi:hypothetical protein
MSWYTRDSKSTVEAQRKAQEAEREERNKVPFRVFLKQSEDNRKLIYLDDEGFSFWEHAINVPGQGWRHFTCLRPNPGCPMCAMGDRPYYVTLFSVVDTREYTDKNGQVHKNQKKIHALKTEAAGKFFKLREQSKGLKGKSILVSRGGPTEASSGSMFLVERDANDRQVSYKLPETPEYQPFDYADLYAPKPIDQLRAALGLPVGDSSVGGSPKNDLKVSHDAADPIPLEADTPAEAKTDIPKTVTENEDVPF